MADQTVPEAVIDQPGVTGLAGEAETALAAERERCVAAPVQKQQRLLAPIEGSAHGLGKARRDEAAARRPFAAQIDGLDRRQLLAAEALRQVQAGVAAAPRIDFGLH